ncbi:MAG: hypothetical protein P8X50_15355, partial [Maritimibacter sp.]
FVDLGVKPFDFLFVQQEFSDSERFMIGVVGKGVLPDVHLINKHFTIYNPGIGILKAGLAEPQGFDFGSFEDQAGLVFVFDKVVKSGFAVDRNDFDRVSSIRTSSCG